MGPGSGPFDLRGEAEQQRLQKISEEISQRTLETLRQIQAFQLVRQSKGAEATPSGWRPGKPTLKPGPDLVGRVWETWKTSMAFD